MGVHIWQLSVSRAGFGKALRRASQAGKAVRSATATLTFDQNHLSMDLLGIVEQVPASGDWPSEVRLSGQSLERLAKALPDDDPLPLKVEGERLFIARFSVPCEWRLYSRPVSTPARELLPADPDLFDLLMMTARCSQEEIDSAGASDLVTKAQLRLEDLCKKAASYLGSYGVSPLHLRRLCEEHATEGSRHFRESDLKTVLKIANAWVILAPLGVEPLELKALMDQCLRNAWKSPNC